MIDATQHPLLLIAIAALSYPVYRGLALAIFGNEAGFAAAIKYLRTPTTWKPLNDPWSADRMTDVRWFVFAALCVGFVAAIYYLCVRYAV